MGLSLSSTTLHTTTMRISAKTEYACIAVLELAVRYEAGEPVRIREIADAHGIPSRFLVQILLQLKGAGLVASTRGACGGYRLIKSPAEITLGAVMQVIDGDSALESNASVETPTTQVLLDTWREAAQAEDERLHGITFADLAQRTTGQPEGMYYI